MGSAFEAGNQGSEGSEGRQDGCCGTSLRLEEAAEQLEPGPEEVHPIAEQGDQHPERLAGMLEEGHLEEAELLLDWGDRW